MIGTAIWAAAAMMAGAQGVAATSPPADLRQPGNVVKALQQAGYKAEMKLNDAGEPYVLSATNGEPFSVDFYECEGLKDCKSFQFRALFRKDPIFTAALANEWNRTNRFLKIAVDGEGNLNQYLDATAVGGVTQAQFAELLVWYTEMDGALARFLAEKRNAAKAATPASAPASATAPRRP